jgi:hypothetical protein
MENRPNKFLNHVHDASQGWHYARYTEQAYVYFTHTP